MQTDHWVVVDKNTLSKAFFSKSSGIWVRLFDFDDTQLNETEQADCTTSKANMYLCIFIFFIK